MRSSKLSQTPFDEYELRVLKVCERLHITLDEWDALSDRAKDMHLAYEVRRERLRAKWRKGLIQNKAFEPSAATLLYLDAL